MTARDAGSGGIMSDLSAEQIVSLIAKARNEIAELCAPRMVSGEIPDAQRHIDAVISMTEQAAQTILDEAEAINGYGGQLARADKDSLQGSCTRIIEACEFQDITVQRIVKVLKTLQTLEMLLARLQESLGLDADVRVPAPVSDRTGHPGEAIDGPAFAGEGVTQDSIDDMFKD